MPSVRLTDRDLEILRWLAGLQCATAPQVGRRFAMAYRNASRRLGQLAGAGYLRHERLFFGRPGVYLVTADGAAIAGALAAPAEVSARTYRHDLAVVDLLIDLEEAGEQVATGRMLAAGPGASAAAFLVDVGAGERARHYPDLVVDRGGERWPVELELEDASADALGAVLAAYRDAGVGGVIVQAEGDALVGQAERLAGELGLKVDVQRWAEHQDAPGDPWRIPG